MRKEIRCMLCDHVRRYHDYQDQQCLYPIVTEEGTTYCPCKKWIDNVSI